MKYADLLIFFLDDAGFCSLFYGIFKLHDEGNWWEILPAPYEMDGFGATDRLSGWTDGRNDHTNVRTKNPVL